MLNTNYCDPDEKYCQKMLILIIFRVYKFWRGEEDESTANTALNIAKNGKVNVFKV